jgi:hypothetical protein
MNYIQAKCFTNLDDYICHVTEFVAVPKKGQQVQVSRRGCYATLKVVNIVHKQWQNSRIPFIEVELS